MALTREELLAKMAVRYRGVIYRELTWAQILQGLGRVSQKEQDDLLTALRGGHSPTIGERFKLVLGNMIASSAAQRAASALADDTLTVNELATLLED